jgi:hypothetical protein
MARLLQSAFALELKLDRKVTPNDEELMRAKRAEMDAATAAVKERQAVAVAARNHRQIWIRLTATGTGRPNRAAIYASVLDAMLTPRWLAAWSRIRVQRQGKVSVRRAHPRADRRSTASSVLDAM